MRTACRGSSVAPRLRDAGVGLAASVGPRGYKTSPNAGIRVLAGGRRSGLRVGEIRYLPGLAARGGQETDHATAPQNPLVPTPSTLRASRRHALGPRLLSRSARLQGQPRRVRPRHRQVARQRPPPRRPRGGAAPPLDGGGPAGLLEARRPLLPQGRPTHDRVGPRPPRHPPRPSPLRPHRRTRLRPARPQGAARGVRPHPHQLRHNAATALREQFGIEAARVVLGHRSAAVTEIYAELDRETAARIMAQVG
jgi:hypothetical protein